MQRIRTNPTRLDSLRIYYNFLGQEAGILQEHAYEIPGLAIQQAWSNYNNGPVGDAAGKKSPAILAKLFLRNSPNRLSWNPLPLSLKTLKGHTKYVRAIAITPDGKHAVLGSGLGDQSCIFWDLERGKCIVQFFIKGSLLCLSLYKNTLVLGENSGEIIILNLPEIYS